MRERQIIVIGSDHVGYELKAKIIENLKHRAGSNRDVIDIGCVGSGGMLDFTKFAFTAAHMVSTGEATHGILIGGAGIEMAMAANRTKGIRAFAATDIGVVKVAIEQLNANVMCLGARVMPSFDQVFAAIMTFLNGEFQMHRRHIRRIEQLDMDFESLKEQEDILTQRDCRVDNIMHPNGHQPNTGSVDSILGGRDIYDEMTSYPKDN